MRLIVAVRGKRSCGKTHSIRRAYEMLHSSHPHAQVSSILDRVELTIIMTIGSTKVGIESQGDPGGRLPASLARFSQAGCHLVICATRSKGKTVREVKAYCDRIVWIEKERLQNAAEYDVDNERVAKKILAAIKAELK